jgi:cyclophilin family peptidyl-prolyl cis-trans isomerase
MLYNARQRLRKYKGHYMSIKRWILLIAACGLMAGLVGAQDATSEATAAATAEATVAATMDATAEAPMATADAAATEAPMATADVASTDAAPVGTQEAMVFNEDAQTPEEMCAAATVTEPETREFSGAENVTEVGVDYRAILCTGAGPVYVDLFEDIAPKTVNNFVFLAQKGFYNNSQFHRVIADFMAQGGDPVGNPPGTGGPGYQFEDEFAAFVTFDRPGLLAMANAGANTNGSQFFVTTAVTNWLDFKHTIFGEVLEGYENVQGIEVRDPETATEPGVALNTVIIVTDPASVRTTYQAPVSTLATAEEVETALNSAITTNPLPADITVAEPQGISTVEELVAAAPEDQRAGLEEYYTSRNFQYRVTLGLNNAECNQQYFFSSLRYTIDAYATNADATSVIKDAANDAANTAPDFTREESFSPVFTRDAKDCAGADAKEGRLYLQRGRYVVMIEAVIPSAILTQAPMEAILSNAAGVFESPLVNVYRNER